MAADRPLTAGARATLPLLVGLMPFGFVFGATAADAGWHALEVAAFSVGIFAGAAQLAALDLLSGGAAVGVAVGTALVINSRFLLYSAGLVPWMASEPTARRLGAAYLLTDQAFAVSVAHYDHTGPPPDRRLPFYLGSGITLWVAWQITTQLGAVVGNLVPEGLELQVAVPLMFLTLLVPAVKDRPTLAAAVVSGVVAVMAAPLPSNLGMPVAAVCGIAAGVLADVRARPA